MGACRCDVLHVPETAVPRFQAAWQEVAGDTVRPVTIDPELAKKLEKLGKQAVTTGRRGTL